MNIGRQCGSAEMKQCQRVIPPDIGVLWEGDDLIHNKKDNLRLIL